MTRITLADDVLFLAGKFKHHTRDELMKLVRDKGGSAAISYRRGQVTCLVAGSRSTSKKNSARRDEIPIMGEAELMKLLEHGEIEVSPEVFIKPIYDLARSISELRAIFDGEPTSKTWTRCIEVIEKCEPSRRQELVAYASPLIARWDDLEMEAWSPKRSHAMMSGVHAQMWSVAVCDPELRVAPPIWLWEMLRGRYFAKHSLARSINLSCMRTDGAHMIALLENPYLAQMHTLVLGAQNTHNRALFETLRTHPNSRRIETLYVDLYSQRDHDDFIDVMRTDDHQLVSLKQLHIHANFNMIKSTASFRALPPFAHVEIDLGLWPHTGKGWHPVDPQS